MDKVIPIYEAKTNLSKLVKRAQAGQTIYIGAYGQPQAVISPLPPKQKINIGIWDHKKIDNAYKYHDLVDPDPDIVQPFEAQRHKPQDHKKIAVLLKRLQELPATPGSLKSVKDPVAWQRELREDRSLTGRE